MKRKDLIESPGSAEGLRIPTLWRVITGAPCSGKTTVINALAAMACETVPETARSLIEEGLRSGMAMAEILRDRDQFERRILSKNAGIAETLPVDRPVFLDRAIPDSIAYFRFHGLDDAAPLHLSQKYRYRRVFFMEPVPYHNDPIRLERQAEAGEIARLLEAAYAALGYPLIRVPFLPVNERARFILERS